MDIVIGRIVSAGKEPFNKNRGSPGDIKLRSKNRRQNKQDRRKDMGHGIILSFKDDQRIPRDRRRVYL